MCAMTWMAQLFANGSSEGPPAFTESGSKPPPMPALEQNSAIGPNFCSVSSIRRRMSFSCPTSHLNAAPSIEAATASAPAKSSSATTTLAAPARWKASQSPRLMPLAPPVTTTILPVTGIATPAVLKAISVQNEIEHGGIMAGRAEQHEVVPDRVLKSQALPGMKDDPETVEQTAGRNEPQRQRRQRHHHGVVQHEAAPAHRQIEPDREPVEPARKYQLDHDPDNRHAPHAGQKRDGKNAVLHLGDERRIGCRHQHIT